MMNQLIAAAMLVATAVAAPGYNGTSTAASPSASCQALFDACRSTGDPNLAACAASSASCFGNIATATSLSPSASCQAKFDACRGTGDPNLAACAASSASCFGSIATGSVVYTTEVVTAITTYCPAPTTITHGQKTYTVTSATTLTIADCPCTVTKPLTKPAAPSSNATVSVGTPLYRTTQPAPVPPQPTTVLAGPPLYRTTQAAAPSRTIVAAGAAKVVGSVQAALIALVAAVVA